MVNIKKFIKIPILTFILSPKLFFLEVKRRIFGKPYCYNGFKVENASQFGFLFYLLLRKAKFKNNILYINGLKFFASDIRYLLATVFEEEAHKLKEYKLSENEIKGKRVLDVGAYIGDTVIGFVKKGAKYVIGYEPVFYDIAIKNLKLNKIKNAKIIPYGVSDRKKVIYAKFEYAGTGLHKGKDVKIVCIPWKEVLKDKFDIAKVDCEGCEFSLLNVNKKLLRKIPLWLIEIHGNPYLLIKHFENAGFKAEKIYTHDKNITIWKFELIK